jgi:hypothetical protein
MSSHWTGTPKDSCADRFSTGPRLAPGTSASAFRSVKRVVWVKAIGCASTRLPRVLGVGRTTVRRAARCRGACHSPTCRQRGGEHSRPRRPAPAPASRCCARMAFRRKRNARAAAAAADNPGAQRRREAGTCRGGSRFHRAARTDGHLTVNAPMSSGPRSPTCRRAKSGSGGRRYTAPAYRGVRGARRGCGEGCDARSVDVIGTQRR